MYVNILQHHHIIIKVVISKLFFLQALEHYDQDGFFQMQFTTLQQISDFLLPFYGILRY